jgi:membrane protein DedA with SNARE-associated domain
MTTHEFFSIAWPAFWIGCVAGMLLCYWETKKVLRRIAAHLGKGSVGE